MLFIYDVKISKGDTDKNVKLALGKSTSSMKVKGNRAYNKAKKRDI